MRISEWTETKRNELQLTDGESIADALPCGIDALPGLGDLITADRIAVGMIVQTIGAEWDNARIAVDYVDSNEEWGTVLAYENGRRYGFESYQVVIVAGFFNA